MPKKIERSAPRSVLSVRITPSMRDSLLAVASSAGRSLSSEVELRLEMSFDREKIIDALAERLKAKPS